MASYVSVIYDRTRLSLFMWP